MAYFGGDGLTKNYRLVEYFVSEFYMRRPEELEHIISPTFIFKNGVKEDGNFAQYVEAVSAYLTDSEIKIDNISSEDDVGFIVSYRLKQMSNTAAYGQEIFGQAKIVIKNNLIELAEVGFESAVDQVVEFKRSES